MEETVTIPRDLAEWCARFLRGATSSHGWDTGEQMRAKAAQIEEYIECASST